MYHDILKNIPPVNEIIELPEIRKLAEAYSRGLVVNSIRNILAEIRQRFISNIDNRSSESITNNNIDFSANAIANLVIQDVKNGLAQTLERAINATGIILHTSLGRSPLPLSAIDQIAEISQGYSTLEVDKTTGKRSSRYRHIQSLISLITGAEDALLVNNNAAAVLLVLDTLARGKEVIVSRSQLVEIGGSFRMPEVMEKSGAILVEVGTTNRTYISDYKKAISEKTGVILLVHSSNFRIVGFTTSPTLEEIASLGKEHNIPTVYDLGSGAMIDFKDYNQGSITSTSPYPRSIIYNLPHEPTVKEGVEAGIDIITFSTDKLLGGPQGGLIIGKKELIDLCKGNPLLRALRVDKITIAGLDATLRLYLNESRALEIIPILRMMFEPIDSIERRCNRLQKEILKDTDSFFSVSVEDGTSEIGGGSLPEETIPTRLICISSSQVSAEDLSKALRLNKPPIFGRIEHDRVLLDLRTVIGNDEEKEVLKALKRIIDNKRIGCREDGVGE